MVYLIFILFLSILCILFWSFQRSLGFHLTCTLILTFFISNLLFQYAWFSTYNFPLKGLITVVISIFLYFSFQQVAIWLQQAPDMIKVVSSILLSVSLFIISPESIGATTSGLLGGILIGFYLEHIKFRAQICSDFKSKAFASLLGLLGFGIITLLNASIPLSPIYLYLTNFLLGLWISFFSTFFFVKLGFYKERKITAKLSQKSTF